MASMRTLPLVTPKPSNVNTPALSEALIAKLLSEIVPCIAIDAPPSQADDNAAETLTLVVSSSNVAATLKPASESVCDVVTRLHDWSDT